MTHRRGRPPHPDVLTPAEWRVLDQLREGQPNAEIAVRLGISVNTVRTHVSNMLAKLEVPDRHALAAWDGHPKRRFGWLPALPLPHLDIAALGLGGLGRGIAVAGGTAAVAAAVVALVLARGGEPQPRTDILLLLGEEPLGGTLIGLDPLTGAPLADAESLDLTDRLGGPLTRGGGLLWYASFDEQPDESTMVLTVVSGLPLGLAQPEQRPEPDGIVQSWSFPAAEGTGFAALSWPGLVSASGPGRPLDDGAEYGVRIFYDATPDEVWRFDLTSGQSELVATVPDLVSLLELRDGRLFAVVHSVAFDFLLAIQSEDRLAFVNRYLASANDYVLELDPEDGRELARFEFGGGISSATPSPDGKTVYVFGFSSGEVMAIDLETMATTQFALPPGGPQPGLPLFGSGFTAVVSPNGDRLYMSGNDQSSCFSGDTPCDTRPLGFRAIDLATHQVLYADGDAETFAMSSDGHWLITWRTLLDDNFQESGDGLKVIDATALKQVAHLEAGKLVEAVAIRSDGQHAYAAINTSPPGPVTCRSACGTVAVIDLDRLEVVAEHSYDEPLRGFFPLR